MLSLVLEQNASMAGRSGFDQSRLSPRGDTTVLVGRSLTLSPSAQRPSGSLRRPMMMPSVSTPPVVSPSRRRLQGSVGPVIGVFANRSEWGTRWRLSPVAADVVATLGKACSDNALDLVEEANLLADNDHPARGFALTILAAEELGKAFVCVLMLANPSDDAADWSTFWQVIGGKQHETKVWTALYLEQHLLEATGVIPDELSQALAGLTAKPLNEAKFQALYVDLDDNGSISAPSDLGSDEASIQRARTLRRSIVPWAVAMQVGSFSKPTD
jgi:AbiV family abortive infection protein